MIMQDIKDVLKPFKRWFILGLHLGIPTYTLRSIMKDSSSSSCKDKMLHIWLRKSAHSWNGLEEALKRMGEDKLAALIAHGVFLLMIFRLLMYL